LYRSYGLPATMLLMSGKFCFQHSSSVKRATNKRSRCSFPESPQRTPVANPDAPPLLRPSHRRRCLLRETGSGRPLRNPAPPEEAARGPERVGEDRLGRLRRPEADRGQPRQGRPESRDARQHPGHLRLPPSRLPGAGVSLSATSRPDVISGCQVALRLVFVLQQHRVRVFVL